jgi:hypothetical protein
MKLSYDEVLEHFNEDRRIDKDDIPARVLRRRVWVAAWGLPGCLYETQVYCETKKDAVNSALFFADGDDGPPRGMRKGLEQDEMFYSESPIYGTVVTTVYPMTVKELI